MHIGNLLHAHPSGSRPSHTFVLHQSITRYDISAEVTETKLQLQFAIEELGLSVLTLEVPLRSLQGPMLHVQSGVRGGLQGLVLHVRHPPLCYQMEHGGQAAMRGLEEDLTRCTDPFGGALGRCFAFW